MYGRGKEARTKMARKGKVLWEVSKRVSREGSGYIDVQLYALREDGALLRKNQTRNADGSTRFDWGWKIARRNPNAQVLEKLRAIGYS